MEARPSPYCGSVGPDGFRCVLLAGHADEDCLSIDNRKVWKGTPGAPVRWKREIPRQTTGEVPMESLDPMLTQGEAGILPEEPRAQRRGPQPPPAEPKPQAARVSPTRPPAFNNGRQCEQCGSLNTIPDGTCFKCLDCYHSGTCGG